MVRMVRMMTRRKAGKSEFFFGLWVKFVAFLSRILHYVFNRTPPLFSKNRLLTVSPEAVGGRNLYFGEL
jgi:hypothetical protein